MDLAVQKWDEPQIHSSGNHQTTIEPIPMVVEILPSCLVKPNDHLKKEECIENMCRDIEDSGPRHVSFKANRHSIQHDYYTHRAVEGIGMDIPALQGPWSRLFDCVLAEV